MKTVYAFFGLGKTTLAQTYPDVYFDDDMFVPFEFKTPAKPQNQVRLTNNPEEQAELYFLPKNLELNKEILKELGKMDFFNDFGEDFLETQYSLVKNKKNVFYVDHLSHDFITDCLAQKEKSF